jgi:hypothetical protein
MVIYGLSYIYATKKSSGTLNVNPTLRPLIVLTCDALQLLRDGGGCGQVCGRDQLRRAAPRAVSQPVDEDYTGWK